MRKIIRICALCGEDIIIEVNQDKSYSGGNYFGKLHVNDNVDEYWECDTCYNSWPEDKAIEQ